MDGSHSCSNKGHVEIVTLLLQRGADINKVDRRCGWTALTYAAEEGQLEIVTLLVERGADVNAADEDEWTALMRAAGKGHEEIVTLLLERGADVNKKNERNASTALMRAAANGHTSVVRVLIEHDADITKEDSTGKSARTHADRRGHTSVVKLLDAHRPRAHEDAIKPEEDTVSSHGNDDEQARIDPRDVFRKRAIELQDRFDETTKTFGPDVTNLVSETCRRNDEFSEDCRKLDEDAKKADADWESDRERILVEEWGCKMVHSVIERLSADISNLSLNPREGDRNRDAGSLNPFAAGPSTSRRRPLSEDELQKKR